MVARKRKCELVSAQPGWCSVLVVRRDASKPWSETAPDECDAFFAGIVAWYVQMEVAEGRDPDGIYEEDDYLSAFVEPVPIGCSEAGETDWLCTPDNELLTIYGETDPAVKTVVQAIASTIEHHRTIEKYHAKRAKGGDDAHEGSAGPGADQSGPA